MATARPSMDILGEHGALALRAHLVEEVTLR